MAKHWLPSPEKPRENSLLCPEARRGLDMIRCFTSLLWARRLPSCHSNKSASTAIAARRSAVLWSGIRNSGANRQKSLRIATLSHHFHGFFSDFFCVRLPFGSILKLELGHIHDDAGGMFG